MADIPESIQRASWAHLHRRRLHHHHTSRQDRRNVAGSEGMRVWVEGALNCGRGRLSQGHVRCAVICVVYGIDLEAAFHFRCSSHLLNVPLLDVSADDGLCRGFVVHIRFREWYHGVETSLATLMVLQS